jgi:cytochrome P450
MYALDTASLSTIDHNKHRERRAALNPFFSTANVRRLQPLIEEKVNLFVERLRGLRDGGEVSRLVVMLSAFSNGEF